MRVPQLPDLGLRLRARDLYGQDPFGYENGRPDYPQEVYDLLRARCGLQAGATVLEIGPGTGRVTRRLTALGVKVVAVEPDAALAAYLRADASSDIEVVDATCENVLLPPCSYDLVIAAMSLHWLDQDVALPKLGSLLRSNGWAVIWWTLFADPSRADPFGEATRHLMDPLTPVTDAGATPPFELDVEGWKGALTQGARLTDFDAKLIHWTADFDLDQLRALYASMINIRRLPAQERDVLLNELVAMARSKFGGIVRRPFVTAVYAARKP